MLRCYCHFCPFYPTIIIRKVNKVYFSHIFTLLICKLPLHWLDCKLFSLVVNKFALERPLTIFKLNLKNSPLANIRTNNNWLIFRFTNIQFERNPLCLILVIKKGNKPIIFHGFVDDNL